MDNKTELWLGHPEIEKIEVSSFGRVRTLDRTVPSSWNATRLVKGKVLKQSLTRLSKENTSKRMVIGLWKMMTKPWI